MPNTAAVPEKEKPEAPLAMAWGETPEQKDDGLPWQVDLSGSGHGSADLKKFLSRPDREAIADTGDHELIAEFNRAHAVAVVHVSGIPFQVKQRDEKWYAKGDVDGQVHRFTAGTRDEVIAKAMRCVQENAMPGPRELTEQEKKMVVILAQSGDIRGALDEYLRLAIGEELGSGYENPAAMLSDPKLSGVYDDCALLVWFAARPNVEDSPDFHAFLATYRGGRPLNLPLLDAAHAAWTAHAGKQVRADAVARFTKQEEPTAEEIADGLEAMSDTEITKQFYSVAKAALRGAR